ncbi:MAG: anhydro-N-acetylmuramic acid kinase [Pseudomonadota bacterium]
MAQIRRAIGAMTGTSMDGLDLALVETDGEAIVRPIASYARPFSALERDALRDAIAAAEHVTERTERPRPLENAERLITEAHAEGVARLLWRARCDASQVDVIGFHGQTVLHRPADALTIQLGDGMGLARNTGIDVVHDFRAADVAAGGEGAPLAPVFHRALAKDIPGWPVAFLNIGGVANVTWVSRSGQMRAFDTGPGNALIDDFVRAHSNGDHDEGGELARAGTVDEGALTSLLRHGYFSASVPKSLDRNAFDAAPVADLSLRDGAATLTAFTAEAVARARYFFSEAPGVWVVCGGGRHNRAIMMALAERVEGLVAPAEAFGLDGDMLEAQAFAYLAVRSLDGLPLSFPATTGVAEPTTGGVMARYDQKAQ